MTLKQAMRACAVSGAIFTAAGLAVIFWSHGPLYWMQYGLMDVSGMFVGYFSTGLLFRRWT